MRSWTLLLVLPCAMPVMADQYQGTKRASVDVSAEGRVTQVELVDALPEAMAASMRREIETWSFTPARVDGKAVPSRTHVVYSLRAKALEGGGYGVEIADVRNGPLAIAKEGLRYPEPALRRGAQGTVYLRLTIAADGSVSEVEPLKETRAHSALVTAAQRAARTWRFAPEQVDGRPVEGRVVAPVRFCLAIQGNPCEMPRVEAVAGVPVRSDGEAVPLNTVVKLDSEVEGRLLGGS